MKRLRVPLSYPAPDGFDGVSQAACRGGSVAVESVAAFAWNGWQASSGISGNLGLEYAPKCRISGCYGSRPCSAEAVGCHDVAKAQRLQGRIKQVLRGQSY